MILFLTALLGAVFGSFANVLIIRWHEEASLMGRSACPSCKKTLRPRHLVPVLSWIFLRGRCADCGAKIHYQYPLIEAAAAVFAMIAALRHDPVTDSVPFLFEFIVTIGLLVPVAMDIRWRELPVEYLVGLGAFSFATHAFLSPSSILDAVIAAALPVAFFGLQTILSRGKWVGAGDVWFGGMMGAILGTPLLAALGLYLGYLFGGLMALVGLLAGLYRRGSRVPFAPALAAGTLVALWHGDRILAWIAAAT